MDVPFPTVPDKHGRPGAYRPAAFLEALRAGGWLAAGPADAGGRTAR